ncbi:MAG: 50S ribosomal protein L17 [Treponemataceae bacterium]|nr:MAG: 50S ribosomal protein L17 [Treponemataceae bacterium]
MNHKSGFNPLSRTAAHQRAMSRNMVTSLLRYERITTTKAKAKEVRKAAEKIITRGKVDSVHNRRQAARFIWDKHILAKLFTDIGPRMKDRPGGYTRILKLGFRANDAADIVILELVDYEFKDKTKKTDADKKVKAPKTAKSAKTDKGKQGAKENAEKSRAPRAAKSAKPKSTVNKAAIAEKAARAEISAAGGTDVEKGE